MKKILLSLAAVLVATSSFAYDLGDYIYTTAAKYKVVGSNLVGNLSSWTGADDADVWSAYTGEDAVDNCLQSLDGAESAVALSTSCTMTFGSSYVITMKVKAPNDATSSITEAAQNQIDVWTTVEDAAGSKTGTAGTDYVQVAATSTLVGGEWTTISFAYTNTGIDVDGEALEANTLNIKIGRLTTETVIADVQVVEVQEVYDTRVFDAKVTHINNLKATGAFTGDSSELDEVIETYEAMVKEGQADDPQTMAELEAQLDEACTGWMDENSSDFMSKFQYSDITSFGRYNRGQIANGKIIGGFIFRGDNWLHAWDKDSSGAYSSALAHSELNKQIQGSYANSAGSAALYNENMPAGKYYVACEVRNANVDKSYAATFTLEKNVYMYLGGSVVDDAFVPTTATEPVAIKGEGWTKLFIVADLKEGDKFEAGPWWEGHTAGSSFQVRNFEVRSIAVEGEESAEEKLARAEAAKAFLAQYNAASSNRETINIIQADTETYPWGQGDLADACTTWDPYFDAVADWVIDSETVADKSVCSTDDLNKWALYQGDEEAAATYGTDEQAAATYQVVRGYQAAINAIKEANKPNADLKALVKEVNDALKSGKYCADDTDVKSALEPAEELLKNISTEALADEFNAAYGELKNALDVYYDLSSSYATPAEIAIVDPNFTDKKGNIAGGTTTYWNDATNQTGWVSYTTDSKAYFRVGDGGKNAAGEVAYEGTNRANMWRGWTGNPTGSLTQEITVVKAGHYDFTCQAFATGDDAKILNGVRKVNTTIIGYETNEEGEEVEITQNDTIYMSGIHLIFGSSSATANLVDSLEIWSAGETVALYDPQWYTLSYDKATDGEEVLKFGIDGFAMAEYVSAGIYTYGPNAYGLGSCHVRYCGPSDKYYADKKAAEEGGEPVEVTIADITNLIDDYLDGTGSVTIADITDLIDKYLAQ